MDVIPVGYLNVAFSDLLNPQTRPTFSLLEMWLLIAGITPVLAALLIGLPTDFIFERFYAAPQAQPEKSPG